MCCAVRQFSVGSYDNDNDECDLVLITKHSLFVSELLKRCDNVKVGL